MREVIKRAAIFQKYLLSTYLGKNVIAVTHGNFIRCFIIYCILGKSYDDKSFYKIFDVIHTENTGISLLEYDEEKKKWDIEYLNDHSHLECLTSL